MSKFKTGDKLRCLSDSGWCGSEKGIIWTFASYYDENDPRFIRFKETQHIEYANDYADNWELAYSSENPMPELKSGMRVTLRCGMNLIVISDLKKFYKIDGFMRMENFDLVTGKFHHTDYDGLPEDAWDIVKVYQGYDNSNFMNIEKLGTEIWQEVDPIKQAKQKRIDELTEIILSANKELESLSEN